MSSAKRGRGRANVAYRAGVKRIGWTGLAALLADADRTTYRFDVRSAEEYRAGHLPGFVHAPGGQLVQETDHHAPVRGARIVLADPLGPRADMTGSWLAQMGWETYVLEDGFERGTEIVAVAPPPRRAGGPVQAALRRHRQSGRGDAGLSRMGVRPRRSARPRRHARLLRHLKSEGRHHERQIHRLYRLQQSERDPRRRAVRALDVDYVNAAGEGAGGGRLSIAC